MCQYARKRKTMASEALTKNKVIIVRAIGSPGGVPIGMLFLIVDDVTNYVLRRIQ